MGLIRFSSRDPSIFHWLTTQQQCCTSIARVAQHPITLSNQLIQLRFWLCCIELKEPHHSCGAYSWSIQCESRIRVKKPPSLIRLETQWIQQYSELLIGIVHNQSTSMLHGATPSYKLSFFCFCYCNSFRLDPDVEAFNALAQNLTGRERSFPPLEPSPVHLNWDITARIEAGQSRKQAW